MSAPVSEPVAEVIPPAADDLLVKPTIDVDAGQTAAGADEQTTDVDTTDDTGASDDVVAQDDTPDDSKAGRQAAKYRAQLRDAQATIAERDTQLAAAQAALAAQQRAIVDRIAGADGPRAPFGDRGDPRRPAVAPEILDANGFQLADMLDNNGNVDAEKVEAFAAATAAKFNIRPLGFAPNRGQTRVSMPPHMVNALTGGNKGGMADAFRSRGAGSRSPENDGMYNGYPI
jgi:hypothetical protein